MPSYADDDLFSPNSHFLSAHGPRGSPSKQSISARRSSTSLRGPSSLANEFGDDSAPASGGGRQTHSLAHELAVALMPEPSAGSKLLAEEFGLEFDEGAEGIDEREQAEHDYNDPQSHISEHDLLNSSSNSRPSFADELGGHDSFDASYAGEHEDHPPGLSPDAAEESFNGQAGGDLDPTFDSPSISRVRPRQKTPEKDAMDILSENLEFTDKFISQLRTLDSETSSSQQPQLERLASDVIRRINDSVRDRETQVRVLLECEREFRKISGEVGGGDLLGQLDELEDLVTEGDERTGDSETSSPPPQHHQPRSLHTLLEEDQPSSPISPGHSRFATGANDWELDPDRGHHLGDYENDEPTPSTSPIRTSFPPAPTLTGAPTPAKIVPQLTHIRSFTSSTISSLTSISEHAQVNGVATADAGRKIRSLKNKLGTWKTEWESAERSRVKIERWEAGIVDSVDDSTPVPLTPSTPTRFPARRVDGRKLVKEQLEAFELALADAAIKTQAIMAR